MEEKRLLEEKIENLEWKNEIKEREEQDYNKKSEVTGRKTGTRNNGIYKEKHED